MRRLLCCVALVLTAVAAPARAQSPRLPSGSTATTELSTGTQAEEADPLRRDNPRSAVLGFLEAARAGDYTLAAQYLETRLSGKAAEDEARHLFAVLDARLPPRLTQISDRPEGSRADPLNPDREDIGVITGAAGDVTISVRRVVRSANRPLWYFSAATLNALPRLYAEVATEQQGRKMPRLVDGRSFAGLRLIDWFVVLVALPLFFIAAATLDRILLMIVRPIWRRRRGADEAAPRTILPLPARVLLLALIGPWLLARLPLSLLARQFWSSGTGVVVIISFVWLAILLNGQVESLLLRRLVPSKTSVSVSLLRVGRRVVDILLLACGLFAMLWQFGIDPTPALAGLGLGGIAIALAAQKTLENMIAGASLVFDQAVRVGDYLRIGTLEGSVDHIGLRSTRVRTPDRSIVSVPNSQIASASVETLSVRDKYLFNPELHLRYETTPEQMTSVLEGVRRLLNEHTHLDRTSIRVRFVRIGSYSLDVGIFAYVFARDWNHFLELQEGLLFGVTDVIDRAGTGLAVPFSRMTADRQVADV